MSASIIQARYEELEQIATRFDDVAEQHQALLERVKQQVDILRGGSWQGKGVAAFLREIDGEVVIAELRLITAVQQAAQVTQQIVNLVRSADLAACQPFQSKVGANLLPQQTENGSPETILPPTDLHIDPGHDVLMDIPPIGQHDEKTNGSASHGVVESPRDIRDELGAKIRSDLGRLPNENGEQCVRWVQDRVENITGQRPPAIGNYGSDVGADNYRFMFDGTYFSAANAGSLMGLATPGSILVWTRAQLDNGAGHVAVVERATSEGIWISEANWDANSDGKKTAGEGLRFVKKEDLVRLGLYMIPAGANAASPGQFATRKNATI